MNEKVRAKRQTVIQKAVTGDLVVALHRGSDHDAAGIAAIEQVTDEMTAEDIQARWKDQGIVDGTGPNFVQIWECRPGSYYRRRTGR